LPRRRHRREDLPLLVTKLLERMGAGDRAEAARITGADGLAELERHPWPGNVRELKNHIERCLALPSPAPLVAGAPAAAVDDTRPFRDARDEFERRYLAAVLDRTGGNVPAAAPAPGRDRREVYPLAGPRGLAGRAGSAWRGRP